MSWQAVLGAGLAVLLASSITVVVKGQDPASADTFVTNVTRAVVHLPNGVEQPAKIGARLPRGAVLRTGPGGGARLTTEGRDVYVGALSTVQVLDGVRQVLQRGQLMIDTHDGPAMTLTTTVGDGATASAGTVSAPRGALARVEENVATLRLAVYRGSARIRAAGRRASSVVRAYYQARVPYGGVPEPATALALTVRNGVYDTWEQLLVTDLVHADIDLNSLASGLNGPDGQSVLTAAPVALRSFGLLGQTQGEQALAVAVAQKGRLHSSVGDNLIEVERDRGEGGSWGVVAAIVRAPVSDVTSVLSTLDLNGGQTSPVLAGPAIGHGLRGQGSSSGGGRPTPSSSQGGSPRPTASPTVSPTPPSAIDQAVSTVEHALPTPTPTPPVATPSPTSSPVGGLVNDVLKLPGLLGL